MGHDEPTLEHPLPSPRVAVVAIHGVADQKPGTTAQGIASLLLDHCSECVTDFVEEPIRIPLEPLDRRGLDDDPATGAKESQHDNVSRNTAEVFLRYRPADLEERSSFASRERRIAPDIEEFGHEFMKDQLREYEPDPAARSWETIRARSESSKGRRGVDVYELHWADLSSIGGGQYRIFAELYQLILHLPSLGRKALDFASLENDTKFWRATAEAHAWAVRFLTIPVPLLNLMMVMFMAPFLVNFLPRGFRDFLSIVALVIITLVTIGYVNWRWRRSRRARYASLVVFALFVALLGVPGWAWPSDEILVVMNLLLAFAFVLFVARRFDRMRPNAYRFSVLVGVTLVILFIVCITIPVLGRTDTGLVSFRMLEVLYYTLELVWTVFLVFAVCSFIASFIASRRVPRGPARARAIRAAWTSRVTLSLAATLFLALTLIVWQILTTASDPIGGTLIVEPFTPYDAFDSPRQVPATDAGKQLLRRGWVDAIPILFLGLAITITTVVWSLLPSVIAEARPAATMDSKALGDWVHAGMTRWIPLAANALPIAVIVFALTTLVAGFGVIRIPDTGMPEFLGVSGALLLAAVLSRRTLETTRSVLDVMLDVDNYMREHPLDQNPRARIAERYASLLRHVARWKDPAGQGYERVVIVAHSQGTVIAADVLRYLVLERKRLAKSEPDLMRYVSKSADDAIPTILFTMGSPLRQLYAAAFPHHYAWIDSNEASPTFGHRIDDADRPTARDIGVDLWVNAYRTGDYIGRCLWMHPDDDTVWLSTRPAPPFEREDRLLGTSREQLCIGAGAHTHYWDWTANTIGQELCRLTRCEMRAPAKASSDEDESEGRT